NLADREFAGFSQRRDRIVANRDDLDFDLSDRMADAGTGPGGEIYFVSGNRGDGQGLGGAVGTVELAVRQKGPGVFPKFGGHGRAGAEDAAERRERDSLLAAVVADLPPERGRAKGVGNVF